MHISGVSALPTPLYSAQCQLEAAANSKGCTLVYCIGAPNRRGCTLLYYIGAANSIVGTFRNLQVIQDSIQGIV